MKTYIKTTLTILISGMLFSSCEDQLNQANPNQATEDTFWKDETDFNLALTSCYTPLKNALNGGYYGTRGVMLRIARADEVDFRNDISDVYTVNRFTNSNTNSLTQGMFYQFYNALYRTNSIMQKLEEKKEQFSTDFQNSVKGECLFIRGFYLFQLAKEFKDAPLRLTASQSPSTFPLAKSSQADIWAQAKEDLKTAASLLPITNKIGKPTQGAAYAALGKIYVYEENWQEAINVLEPLTQNPYTYKLVEDFNWNFDDTHENNAESIFELLIEDVGGTDLWGDGENINSTQSNTRPKEYAAAEVGGWYEANPTQQIMDIFWKEKDKDGNFDYRARCSVAWDYWQQEGDQARYPRLDQAINFDSRMLEKASFLRLKYIQLAYTLPSHIMEKTKFIKGLKVWVGGRNLWTVTGYNGLDPEAAEKGVDVDTYPNTREFTFGLEFKF